VPRPLLFKAFAKVSPSSPPSNQQLSPQQGGSSRLLAAKPDAGFSIEVEARLPTPSGAEAGSTVRNIMRIV